MCFRRGYWAKRFGYRGNTWMTDQILYWNGKEYPRASKEYQQLLDRLFRTVYTQNEEAKDVLLETEDTKLIHSMGKSDPKETVLTEEEFTSRLMSIRDKLKR